MFGFISKSRVEEIVNEHKEIVTNKQSEIDKLKAEVKSLSAIIYRMNKENAANTVNSFIKKPEVQPKPMPKRNDDNKTYTSTGNKLRSTFPTYTQQQTVIDTAYLDSVSENKNQSSSYYDDSSSRSSYSDSSSSSSSSSYDSGSSSSSSDSGSSGGGCD